MGDQRHSDYQTFIYEGQRLIADYMGLIAKIRVYLNHHTTRDYDDIRNQDGKTGWAELNDPERGGAVSPLPSTTQHIQGTNITPNTYLVGISALQAVDDVLTASNGLHEQSLSAWLGPYR